MTRPKPRARTRKHWYFISEWECQLCSRTTVYRTRRFDKRPADPNKRREWHADACGSHFV